METSTTKKLIMNGTSNGVNGHMNGGGHGNGLASNGHQNGHHHVDHELDLSFERNGQHAGQFLQQITSLIVNEGIIGDGESVKKAHPKLVNFKHPKELEAEFDFSIGDQPTDDEELLNIAKKVVDYSVLATHPHFFNQLYGGSDCYGVAGSWLTDALNNSIATYEIAPIFTLMERWIIEYLGQCIGYSKGSIDGIFAPGGSISNFYAMVLARHRKHPEFKTKGLYGGKQLVVFISEDAHYSSKKGAIWLGMGTDSVIYVATDAVGRMDPIDLERKIKEAEAIGQEPLMVVATSGTTVLGAFDPINSLADICQKYNLWLHVDAALGGACLFSSKHRTLMEGAERADSVTWDLHKLTVIPFQCAAFVTKHPGLLLDANSCQAPYIFQSDKYYDGSYDQGPKSVQCGRKVDSLKAWFWLRAHGKIRVERMVDRVWEIAEYATAKVKSLEPTFKLIMPGFQSNNVCFWYLPKHMRSDVDSIDPEELHKVAPKLKGRFMERGTLMIGYNPLASKKLPNFFRLVVCCTPIPRKEDIDFVFEELERIGNDLWP